MLAKIFTFTVNGNRTRAIALILGISTNTVTSVLKKLKKNGSLIPQINRSYIECNKGPIEKVAFVMVEEAETNEMWSFVYD